MRELIINQNSFKHNRNNLIGTETLVESFPLKTRRKKVLDVQQFIQMIRLFPSRLIYVTCGATRTFADKNLLTSAFSGETAVAKNNRLTWALQVLAREKF